MKLAIKIAGIVAVLAGAAWASRGPLTKYWKERNRPQWETAEVVRGDAKRVITSTGKIDPVLKVSVGAFVSGPIVDLHVDFNDEVQEGQLLAKVDPRLYQASVDRDNATLLTAEAEVHRVQAQLKLAKSNLERGERLRKKNQKYLSDREIDTLTAEYTALEAALKVAQASVAQANAQLQNSQTNLAYCEIKAPVDGVILERKIDPGQTLASQFQTPELFIVAPDLREKMHVLASVDESDIGLIRHAYEKQLPVTFTVDAYPDEVFHGTIEQIRFAATELQNVITYPVVVACKNPDLKLLPSMTAQISFEVDSRGGTLKVPNTALRYYPENIQYVREEDRKLLDGSHWTRRSPFEERSSNDSKEPKESTLSAEERAESKQKSARRHVWVVRNEMLEAIEVVVGFSESRFTVVESDELTEGMQLVTGIKK